MFMGVARRTGPQARIKTEFGFVVKRGVKRAPPRGKPRHRASRPRAKSRQAPSAAGGT